jgi:hypothetical protein
LQQGENPVYVQQHSGHASIELTVDTHGKCLPMGNVAAKLRPAAEVLRKGLKILVSRAGLEPATPCLKGRCSTI